MQNAPDNLPSERNLQILKKGENRMNRIHVKTLTVLVLIGLASVGAFVLTDSFVPQAHADGDCFQEALECLIAIGQAINICADVGIFAPECLAAAENAIDECQEAWEVCFG